MRNIITLTIGLLTLSGVTLAHDPYSARFELHANIKEGALLQIYLTQAGVHEALTHEHPGIEFSSLDPDNYKEMIVAYIKEHTHILGDGTKMEFGIGAIKLGSHETQVKLHLKNYPNKVEKLEIEIDAFSQNSRHHTVFWWYTPEESFRVILSAENQFNSILQMEGSVSDVSISFLETTKFKWVMAGIGIILLSISFFALKKDNYSPLPEIDKN